MNCSELSLEINEALFIPLVCSRIPAINVPRAPWQIYVWSQKSGGEMFRMISSFWNLLFLETVDLPWVEVGGLLCMRERKRNGSGTIRLGDTTVVQSPFPSCPPKTLYSWLGLNDGLLKNKTGCHWLSPSHESRPWAFPDSVAWITHIAPSTVSFPVGSSLAGMEECIGVPILHGLVWNG